MTDEDTSNESGGLTGSPEDQTGLSLWESPHESEEDEGVNDSNNSNGEDTSEGMGGEEINNEDSEDQSVKADTRKFSGVDWERRELSDSYPDDVNYHCNICNEFHSDYLHELKLHIREDEDVTWGDYLKESELHRCAGCGEPLSTLEDLYCDNCKRHSDDRIPCRNCGSVRVNVSDPFCSPECAGERIQATDGAPAPLEAPVNPTDEWLDHPHRLPEGIPTAAPFVENHWLACRECYEYGADSLHNMAVHVSEKHDFGWDGYISRYALRRCRVCETPLASLLPLYCSESCQENDPDPVRTCKRDGCEAAVERRQKYCSRDCYNDSPE